MREPTTGERLSSIDSVLEMMENKEYREVVETVQDKFKYDSFGNPDARGEQYLFRFDNDFGASVICHEHSYGGDEGLYELGVLEFEGVHWSLTYDTPITDDVIGYMTVDDVNEILDEIKELD